MKIVLVILDLTRRPSRLLDRKVGEDEPDDPATGRSDDEAGDLNMVLVCGLLCCSWRWEG